MCLRTTVISVLALMLALAPLAAPFDAPLAAQEAEDDDDDDDGAEVGEDDAIDDPDDVDPAVDDDATEVDDDDAGEVDDDDAGEVDDDDAGEVDDDDAGEVDDDDAGEVDDDDAGEVDDDDGGNDDITDDRDDDEDYDDTSDDEPVQWEIIVGDTNADRDELDDRDGIATDEDGFRYRRGEFIALDVSADELAKLRATGFELIDSAKLTAMSATLLLLRGPPQLTDEAALDALETIAEPETFGFNHLFDSSAVQTTRKPGSSPPDRQACGCEIGLIDTGVATGLSNFKHVALVQRAFNGKQAQARLHGTAVAHLMAGTKRHPARATKIFVADIFGGPRETAGSSFALIKAVDWLAVQGVPVINISLSGPRNAAVASGIARINRRGHIIVAAAGNDGPAAPPVFPGAYEGVVGVTAVDGANRVYRYANRGAYIDFSARGVAVPAIDAKGEMHDATGTSFAAPVIAARLAGDHRTPDAAAAQRAVRALETQARDLGAPGRDPVYGAGLIGGGN